MIFFSHFIYSKWNAKNEKRERKKISEEEMRDFSFCVRDVVVQWTLTSNVYISHQWSFFFFLSLSTIRLFVHSLASEFWAVTRSDFCIETTNRIQCDTLFVLLLLLIWMERFVYKHGEQSFDCAFERPCSYHSDIPVVIDSFSLARYLPYVFMSRSSTNNNNRANWTQKLL